MDHTVSIIIPCYRQGRFLRDSVESGLNQIRLPHGAQVEVVVIDDGSDDNTPEVVAQYASRVTALRHSNRGLPASRNAGVSISKGRYLLFLDADDHLPPTAIADHLAVLESRDDCFSVGGYRTFFHEPGESGHEDRFPPEVSALPHLFHHNFGPPNTYMIPRRLYDAAGGFDPRLPTCEDYDLWTRIALLPGVQIRVVPHVVADYRKVPGSMSSNRDRMVKGRALALVNTGRIILSNHNLLERWGFHLANAVRRVRRRFLIRRLSGMEFAALESLRLSLVEAGFGRAAGKQALLESAFGVNMTDRITLAYYRRFEPRLYQTLLENCH